MNSSSHVKSSNNPVAASIIITRPTYYAIWSESNKLTGMIIRNIKLALGNRAFMKAGVAQHGQRRKTEALIP